MKRKKSNQLAAAADLRTKELLQKTLDAFIIPKPKWKGKTFLKNSKFIKVFNEYKSSDKGYIQSKDVENFVNGLFDDVKKEEVNIPDLKDFIHGYLFFFGNKRQRWISMYDLFDTLEEIMEPNFLLNYRGRKKYSSVDIMQIWTFYNADETMTLDDEEAENFAFDLLLTNKQKCNPLIMKSLIEKIVELSEDGDEISLRGLSKILPIEETVVSQYDTLEELNEEDIKRIFAFYDQDDEGSIDGCELYALVKDILEANGHSDPYNMDIIHESIQHLQHSGGITDEGALNQKCTKVLFTLGKNQTTL